MANPEPSFIFQISLLSIAIFCTLELLIDIFYKFKVYTSLYFKSCVVCAIGVLLFAVGFLILFNHLVDNLYVPLVILTFGWHMMVTGFAVVMYSRLHLVCSNSRIINASKYMIIFNYFVCHLPTTALTFGANLIGTPFWVTNYARYEAFQVTMFFIQEVILGLIYVYYIKRTFPQHKDLVFHTVYIQLAVIVLDMIMVGTEYGGFYDYQITAKTFLYCIKLKLEFAVLNLLQDTVKIKSANGTSSVGPTKNANTSIF
ncbi:hypothetical protein BC833DRAFT_609892 [Globomyces pollinis-pini]|nr:hypothetical protein BC833DRAFT_609892 [Globomyces pollinis-pini]